MYEALNHDGTLGSPSVGTFTSTLTRGALVEGGTTLGVLLTGGSRRVIVAPADARGAVVEVPAAGRWVQFGDPLVRLGEAALEGLSAASRVDGDVPADVIVVRAESDGTVWLRPEPTAPPFAAEGSAVEARATLALTEVMKTFTPVRAPQLGVVARVLVRDGASVTEGAPLFWVRPG